MSTQTEKTPAQLAEEFLRKYATVIGTLDAIDKGDKAFLLKYATVVGSPEAIKNLPDAGQPTTVSDDTPTDTEEGTETIEEIDDPVVEEENE